MGRIFGKAILCGLAGVLAWVFTEGFFPKTVPHPDWQRAEMIYILLVSGFVGVTAGVFHGLQKGGRLAPVVSGVLGLVLGMVGGMLGSAVGGALVQKFFDPNIFNLVGMSVSQVAARTLAIAPLGLFLGAAIGATLMSRRGVVSGMVGGLCGGALAGALFDVVGAVLGPVMLVSQGGGASEVGGPSRAMLALFIGLFIGLMTAIFERASRQAWLRLVLGRNEGREWPIDASQTLIGRDERAHVPLFGDPQIPSLAAVITKQGHDYVLSDPGSPLGVGLNGFQVAQPAILRQNDMIQLGQLQIQFLMKGSAQRQQAEGRPQAQPITPVNQTVQQGPLTPSMPTQAMQSPPGGGIVLKATAGPCLGHTFPITGPTEIGREVQGITIGEDPNVSRRHASVTPTPAGLTVSDLGSTNGTFVNGIKVQSAEVRPGDTIEIGTSVFHVASN
jgi:pSer/pThr/pTyr-binding forkhead associated (FHA) protein